MAGTDWTTLVVALAGVAGTIGASWLGQRALRRQAREQSAREHGVQVEQRRERALQEQHQLYVALNRDARVYRLALTIADRVGTRGTGGRGNAHELLLSS